MPSLQTIPAKICLVSLAIVMYEEKVLLVHHKKLDVWLAPGGHIDPGELPHHAAERECLEETGVQVQVIDPRPHAEYSDSEWLPSPYESNLHWVSQQNYQFRMAEMAAKRSQLEQNSGPAMANLTIDAQWKRGCEQHLGLFFLAQPSGSTQTTLNSSETHGVGWFSRQDLAKLQTSGDIRQQLHHAFDLMKDYRPLA